MECVIQNGMCDPEWNVESEFFVTMIDNTKLKKPRVPHLFFKCLNQKKECVNKKNVQTKIENPWTTINQGLIVYVKIEEEITII